MGDVTMIYVTHDQVEAMTLADRIVVLRDGQLEQVGTPTELYETPNSIFVAGFIGSPKMNFLGEDFAKEYGATTIGIRSEHVVIGDGQPWEGEVVHVEDLGSDHFLFVEIGSEEPLICRQPGKTTVPLGSKVSVGPMMDHLHRFGADGRPVK